jgi:hypothetical protein
MSKWPYVSLVAMLVGLPTSASAAPERMWAVDVGVRETFVRDASFDPYSRNDLLPQASIGGSRTLWANDRFSLAPGLRWDFGASSAVARGADTRLAAHRFTVPVEGRLHLEDWLFAFGRLAPGAIGQSARVTDASLAEPLSHSGWGFAGDLSAGASLRLFGSAPAFWLTPELGYAFAARGAGGLSPQVDEDDPRQFGALGLTGVSLSGWFFRAGMTATF